MLLTLFHSSQPLFTVGVAIFTDVKRRVFHLRWEWREKEMGSALRNSAEKHRKERKKEDEGAISKVNLFSLMSLQCCALSDFPYKSTSNALRADNFFPVHHSTAIITDFTVYCRAITKMAPQYAFEWIWSIL